MHVFHISDSLKIKPICYIFVLILVLFLIITFCILLFSLFSNEIEPIYFYSMNCPFSSLVSLSIAGYYIEDWAGFGIIALLLFVALITALIVFSMLAISKHKNWKYPIIVAFLLDILTNLLLKNYIGAAIETVYIIAFLIFLRKSWEEIEELRKQLARNQR